ncbi:MAG: MFS transporter [Dehalococcoidia bacterium]|nr:MFS transporter [Dehalococcoidia bacterium]
MRSIARNAAGVATAGLAFRARPAEHEGARIAATQVPTAFRAFWADGLFAAAQDAFILSYLPLLASALGASALQIGLLAASQSLGGMLALYPGAVAGRRAASRRRVVLFFSGVLGRLTLLGCALAVAFLDDQPALYTLTALLTVRAFFNNFTLPAWTSLAADIIPPGMRARFFASRNFAINLAGLAITPLGGVLLDQAGFPGGYVTALLVSFALGLCATFAYSRVPEPPRRSMTDERRPFRLGRVLGDGRFLLFIAATASLHFATMLAGPFFNVYLKERLGGTNAMVGMVSTASALAAICGQLLFGDLLARRGALWLSRVTLLAMPLVPLCWLVVSTPELAIVPNLIGGLSWSAFNLANFQLMLELTGEEDREAYVAVFHTCVFAVLFVAPFAGGMLVDMLGYRPVFALSAGARLLPLLLFVVALRRPGKPREASGEAVVALAEAEAAAAG